MFILSSLLTYVWLCIEEEHTKNGIKHALRNVKSNSTPSLGTSVCSEGGPKRTKKKILLEFLSQRSRNESD